MLENSHTYFKNLAAKGKITTEITSENYKRKITTEKALRAQLCFLLIFSTFETPIPQNGHTHSKNLLTKVDKLFECV